MQHLIIIRFNLENERSLKSKINIDRDWFNNRLIKFIRYTYPSLLNQTNQNFKAYLLVHRDTPIDLYTKLKNVIKMDNMFILNVNTKYEAYQELKQCVNLTDFIVQTRFDNDDMYNINLIQIIQDNIILKHKHCLAFNNMLWYNEIKKEFYLCDNITYTSNVTTVVEDPRIELRMLTCGRNHGYYGRTENKNEFSVKFIQYKSPYCLVVHSDNAKTTIETFNNQVKSTRMTITTDNNILNKFIYNVDEEIDNYPNLRIKRTDIINNIIDKYNLNSYLEIGVAHPKNNFDLIHATIKDGVEPRVKPDEVAYNMTSDDFFNNYVKRTYDVIFIDGMHTKEQVYIDVMNSIKYLNSNGFIVLHDCHPPTEWHSRSYEGYLLDKGGWTGDVYKGFIKLKHELKDWNCFVVNENYGCGVITQSKLNKNFLSHNVPYDDIEWQYFNDNKETLLDLVSYNEFIKII